MLSGGGVDSTTFDLCVALADAGDEVTVVGRDLGHYTRQLSTHRAIHVVPQEGYRSYRWIAELVRIIKARGIEIVHAQHGRDYWPAIIAARLSGRNPGIVVSRHLMTTPNFGTRLVLLNFAHVASVSRAVDCVMRTHMRGSSARLHVVYPGVNTDLFNPTSSLETRKKYGWDVNAVVFGMVASITPGGTAKGHHDLLRAAKRVIADCKSLRVALVGTQGDATLLKNQIREMGLAEFVSLIPFTHDIPSLMNAFDVLVMPSKIREALGLVILEAMACGKPVIATRLNGITETFRDGLHGFFVSPGDDFGLAEAMYCLATDASRRLRFGAMGREYVMQNFDRRQYAGRMRALYMRLLSEADKTGS